MSRFWFPVILRFGLIAFVALLAYLIFGLVAGLVIGVLGLGVLTWLHLFYLKRVADWAHQTDHPETPMELPAAYGAWSTVFAEMRRARRREVKERDQVAEELNRFIEAASVLPDGIVILDRGGLIEWCNPSAEKHLGLKLDRDRGFLVLNLVRAPAFTEYLMRADFREPLTITDPVAQTALSVQLLPFQETRRIVVSRDITPFARVETMRRDFIANISHELRTPLTVVGGYLEQLIDQPGLDATRRTGIERVMLDQTQRMQRLIEDLLTLSRLEASLSPERDEEFAGDALVNAVGDEARALSEGQHSIDIEAEPIMLTGSMDELRSAFSNLVSNAVRHTPPGGHVRVRFGRIADGVQFAVSDDGPGIAAEHVPRLTERFYRVDKSRSRETGGTGLGLAIVKHALARHDGRLEVESEVGRGSTFRAVLPARRVA
ncbi:MAG: phosphate regulon sensor histidine kinase PhoR [Burkholderiales bacterium]